MSAHGEDVSPIPVSWGGLRENGKNHQASIKLNGIYAKTLRCYKSPTQRRASLFQAPSEMVKLENNDRHIVYVKKDELQKIRELPVFTMAMELHRLEALLEKYTDTLDRAPEEWPSEEELQSIKARLDTFSARLEHQKASLEPRSYRDLQQKQLYLQSIAMLHTICRKNPELSRMYKPVGCPGILPQYPELATILMTQAGPETTQKIFERLRFKVDVLYEIYKQVFFAPEHLGSILTFLNDSDEKQASSSSSSSQAASSTSVTSESRLSPFSINNMVHRYFSGSKDMLQESLSHLKPLDTDDETPWRHYTVNDASLQHHYNTSQKFYGTQMHKGVLLTAASMQAGNPDFRKILSFLARWRNLIAEYKDSPESMASVEDVAALFFESSRKNVTNRFGMWRTQSPLSSEKTVCVETYEPLGIYLQKQHARNPESGFAHRVTATLDDGRTIKLEKITKAPGVERPVFITHTAAKHIPDILQHAEKLAQRALQSADREETLALLGQTFWWICRAKPFYMGDPSVAEMAIKSLWYSKYNEVMPMWAQSVIPWVEVMKIESPVEFGKHFSEMLVQSASLSNTNNQP